MTRLLLLFAIVSLWACRTDSTPGNTITTAADAPPDWAKDAIWYQIFVERFNNGDTTNDPTAESIAIAPLNQRPPEGWRITPWSQDWYSRRGWEQTVPGNFGDMHGFRRYGGDLQGVINKLDYLQDLGITAIYLNPINHAPSLHKYDATSYHHVDAFFGPDPEGDLALMAKENPADPNTWVWTAADKQFLQLVDAVHQRGMRIIMDYSWNHTGTLFWAWQDVLKNGEKSAYKDWYAIKSFDNPATDSNEFAYQGWLNISSLPEIKKVDVTTERINGKPYEGHINKGARQHIYDVSRRWLAPDGDASKGIDGYRLDVADQVGLAFWRDYRKEVRAVKPDAYLVGEIWWDTFPDQLMNPVPYTGGDIFDAVMFYQVYRPARYYFAQTDFPINARQLADSLQFQWNRLRPQNLAAMMLVNASHDAPRLLTDFYNRNKYKFGANPQDNSSYRTGKPDADAERRARLYLLQQFTSPGAPHIWNGDEMGMWGGDDPHCRKPLMWPDMRFEPETRNNVKQGPSPMDSVAFNADHFNWYKLLIAMRKKHPVLVTGKTDFSATTADVLDYTRTDGNNSLRIIINGSTRPQTVALPASFQTVLALSSDGSANLPPLSALVINLKP